VFDEDRNIAEPPLLSALLSISIAHADPPKGKRWRALPGPCMCVAPASTVALTYSLTTRSVI